MNLPTFYEIEQECELIMICACCNRVSEMLDYRDICADCAIEEFDSRFESDEFLPTEEDLEYQGIEVDFNRLEAEKHEP